MRVVREEYVLWQSVTERTHSIGRSVTESGSWAYVSQREHIQVREHILGLSRGDTHTRHSLTRMHV